MQVQIRYFKHSGKFYADGSYHSEYSEFDAICYEVAQGKMHDDLPGLVSGCRYTAQVEVPEHPNNAPRLVQIPANRG